MKGYVTLNSGLARKACENFENAMQRGRNARSKGIARYRQEVYPHKGWFHRFKYRNYSDIDYATAMVKGTWIWGDLSEILFLVLSIGELDDLKALENSHEWRSAASEMRSLCETGAWKITVDPELARFYTKWRNA